MTKTPPAPDHFSASESSGALSGLKILDLSRILAAPTCTQIFGDLGAEVIKVERPGIGDDTRSWGPPFVDDESGVPTGLSSYFLCANRNKRSIAVDLSTKGGAEIIKRLVKWADVVIENYKPGDLARKGLDYDSLKELKPGLIWCSISGFGQTGPYSDRIGYDFLIQAMGGIMSITGPEGADGTPYKVGVGIADVVCGLYAGVGILAALRHRDATGEGQYIDLSLFDSQLSWLINAATGHLETGKPARRLGNRHPNIVPYQTYPAADGHFVVATGNDRQFQRLVTEIGCAGLGADERFATNAARVAHVDALEEAVTPFLVTETVETWVDRLTGVGVPAGPVNRIDQVFALEHTRAREMIVEMATPAREKPLRLVGNPLNMSATPVSYRHPPPQLAEGKDYVLGEILAMSADQITDLEREGAFGALETNPDGLSPQHKHSP